MPKTSEAEFKKILSGNDFGTLYSISGAEKMLVNYYTNKLIEKVAGKKPSEFNFHTFVNDFNIDEFASVLQIIPFMSDYNVVVLKDLDLSEFSSSDANRITELISSVSGDSIVILTYPTAVTKAPKDMTAKEKKLKELTEKKGIVLELDKLSPAVLQKKLISWASKRNVVLTPRVSEQIVEYTGTDLTHLKNELEKLCSYAGTGGEITSDIVDMLVTKNLEASVFDLSKAVISADSTTAFNVIDRLIYQKVEVLSILAVLSAAYVDMYRARIIIKNGRPVTDMIKLFPGVYKSEYRVLAIERNCKRVNTAILRKSINAIAQTDIALKSTRGDARIRLESLIIKLMLIAQEG